jgi:hypothetical protein
VRTLILGDVHGMRAELEQLLALAGFARGDRLVSLGDLLDKGPDCAGAVRLLRELREDGHDVVLVMGNHEEKHARWRRREQQRVATGRANKMEVGGKFVEIERSLSPADVRFLETAVPWFPMPEHDALAVHAGIPPRWATLGAPPVDWWGLENGDRKHLEGVLRIRFVHADTLQPASLGHQRSGDPFWADLYDGRFGHVYFGHVVFLQDVPATYAHATGLDLGAVHGGWLCAAILQEGEPPRYAAVRAPQAYARRLEDEDA